MWLDLFCAALLFVVICTGPIWLCRFRASKPGDWPGWCAAIALLVAAGLVWAARPWLAERILVRTYDIQPMKQTVGGIPLAISTWLRKMGMQPTQVSNWSSGEGLSKRKLARTEDLRAAMRLLAVCKPRVFTLSCSQLLDFRPLTELRTLEELYLYGTIEADAPLPYLPSVRELRTGGCKFVDFAGIAAMVPQVTVLRISEYPGGLNVRGLEKLERLEHLDIRHCPLSGAGVEDALRQIPRVSGWRLLAR
jgi:hypothetical protein